MTPLGDATPESTAMLLRRLVLLSAPVLVEHVLHMVVGLTDTYLANHVNTDAAAATAAVGTIAYVLWFIGLAVGAIGTGSTAIIARATGARHRRLANSVCGQSVTAAVALGLILAVVMYLAAPYIAKLSGLSPVAQGYATSYLRTMSIAMPFTTLMFIANSCLRGAGDTITPAASMVVVDIVNVVCSVSLVRGLGPLPEMGFEGIAAGTMIAYFVGGSIQFVNLLRGRGGVRLYLHRLRPDWVRMKRILRIGLPSGAESLLGWLANFAVVTVVNRIDATSVSAAAHINAVRLESLSYLGGYAVATAASTLVGQSLGMKDPHRATKVAYLSYAVGGGGMVLVGLSFIFGSHAYASAISEDPQIVDLTARCLFIAGFIQFAFAAALVFGGALRGAGDTAGVMVRSLISVLGVRLPGVLIVGLWMGWGVTGIWLVLCAELVVRGLLIYARFAAGRWKRVNV